jgi:hypothetical protein
MTPHPLITEDERRAYGDEALSVMERKAREVVGPVVNDLNRQNQQLRSELQRVKAHDIYSTLDQNMPNWREINTSQEFLDWLRVPDPYSGAAKSVLLRAAFDSGDANRVLAIFHGFQADMQPTSTARAPRTSADNSRTITTQEIDRFYSDVRKGRYTEKDKDKREAEIHRAILEGRLRRT